MIPACREDLGVDPIYFILIPGLALIASGIVAVFKIATSSDSTFKFLGFEMTTPVPGLIMLGIGAAMIYPPVTELLARKPTITEVVLHTDTGGTEASYGVRCPITIPLEGRISVGGTGGVVSYRFVRTQGLNQPAQASEVRQLNFDAPGTARVSDQITVSIPIGEVYITDTLEIVEPDSRQSVPVAISVLCDPTLPGGPPGPPPDVEPPGG